MDGKWIEWILNWMESGWMESGCEEWRGSGSHICVKEGSHWERVR